MVHSSLTVWWFQVSLAVIGLVRRTVVWMLFNFIPQLPLSLAEFVTNGQTMKE